MGDDSIEAGVENLTIEVKPVLGEKDANVEISEENLCGFCKKSDPTKRCSKRHPKCLKKMFCNETCEIAAHKKKEDPAAAAAKVAAKKAAEKKKKTKSKKENNFGHVKSTINYRDYE
eukprot:TRINITY_DN4749_c0_g1_i2.p1 TRINITY_DN4749_c0_g1~~TRINITY_DN4749_c0_g1_i2.p1  ORF type:complete len:117 (-),score=42.89 TRINITY_DN4749_c0_g1_i2:82-432(-)